MIRAIKEFMNEKTLEAILVAIILVGLTLVFKEQITTLLTNILFEDFNSSLNQLLN